MTSLKGIALVATFLLLAQAAPAQVSFLDATNYNTGVGLSLDPEPTAIAAGDFTEDGAVDLVVANKDDATIQLLINSGLGIFVPATTIDVDDFSGMDDTAQRQARPSRRPYALVVDDFDADTHLDVAVALLGTDQVVVFLGNGNGTFAAGTSYVVGDAPMAIAAGNFDGANGPDLVTANDNDDTVSILMNNGDGTFTAAADVSVEIIASTRSRPQGVVTGDFDGDGNVDVAVTLFDRDAVDLLFGDGTGAFPFFDTEIPGLGPIAIASADLDGDGFLDLVVGNSNSDDVSVLLNDGTANFAAAVNYPAGNYPGALSLGDINGDGFTDIVTANFEGDSVAVLAGVGDGTFGAPVSFTVGGGPAGVALGLYNSDADLDIATANQQDNNVSVLLAGSAVVPPIIPQCGVACGPLGLMPMLLTLLGLLGLKQHQRRYNRR
ncbi:MAG: VCBS repeat-containing protein [Planctomycetota bacterium]